MPYVDRMRSCFRTILPALVMLAVGLTLAASGCAATPEPVPPAPAPAPSPTASVAPVFASNEEALAAATEAYAAYQEMFTLIAGDGGARPERIKSVTSGDYEAFLLREFEDARTAGIRTLGNTTFDGARIQRVDERAADGVGVVVIYLCSDVSQVDLVDANNVSQIDADRIPRTAVEVGFDWEPGLDGVLTVASRTVWRGGGVC